MTPEIRDSEIKGFVRQQKAQGGIVPSGLADGSKILVETEEFMYEITVQSGIFPTPRFILATASPSCQRLGHILLGLSARNRKLKYDLEDWIGKDASLLLKFQGGTNVLTTAVLGATLVLKKEDGSEYKYEMWE